jgi:glycosyltransferase 2 family protein
MSAEAAGTRDPGRRLPLWLLAAVLGYLGLTWLFGGADTLAAGKRIGGWWVVVGLLLTMANFAIRALRWQFLLRRMDACVPWRANLTIYLAGIGLSATPGKVGETVRSALLLRQGVPVGTSLAAFLADRLSDLQAVLLLALLPLAWTLGWDHSDAMRWVVVLALVTAAPMVFAAIVRTPAWPRLLRALAGMRFVGRLADWVQRGALDFVRLWSPAVALVSIACSLLAYGLQGAIFAGMVGQVAPHVGAATALSIFAAATLAGAASFLPGGVGAMELALVLLLRHQGVDTASGLAAALCLRAVTFWFGLLLGALGLSLAARLPAR